jgi:hypothetical protein
MLTQISLKKPLIEKGKDVVGILGITIDITDRRKAEQLKLQNQLQETKLKERERFKILAEQVSHDIQSPLILLDMLSRSCKNLLEKEHISLRNAITSITSIAGRLLNKYVENDEMAYVLFPFCITEVLDGKKHQYKERKNIRFNYSYKMIDNFACIKGDYSDYYRMLSNLINNSADAFKNDSGVVDIKLVEEGKQIKIHIKDNGKGMPKEIVDKIMNDIPVSAAKEGGHGIGMRQVKDTLQQLNGQISIESTEGIGTEIILTFPKSSYPAWFADKIVLHKGDTVVVLDDDPSIHSLWQNRLDDCSNDIAVKYFTQGCETIDFINSFKEKEKIFLLSDYELRGQDINGIDVIEKCAMQKRSVVVTSVYVYRIENFLEKFKDTKFLPKGYINSISIAIEKFE